MESCKEGKRSQTILLVPIITVLLSSILMINIGFAGFNSTVDVSNNPVGVEYILIELTDENDNPLVSGNFSSGIGSIKYSQSGSSFFILGGERTLGSSKIVIDATRSNATNISLSASVTHRFDTAGGTYPDLPYNMEPEFEYRYGDSTGTIISDSENITITPGEINTLYVKFIGKLDTNYSNTEKPVNFIYDIVFEATSKAAPDSEPDSD